METVENQPAFASNLRRLRNRRKLSQEALADLCKPPLHRTEVSLLERGRDPRLSTMVRLARALEVSVSDLVRGIK